MEEDRNTDFDTKLFCLSVLYVGNGMHINAVRISSAFVFNSTTNVNEDALSKLA